MRRTAEQLQHHFCQSTYNECSQVGSVREKSSINIIFKNMSDLCIAAMSFWLFGYAFSYGDGEDGPFIGRTDFALSETQSADAYPGFLFQLAFAATAATIVSGSVAERCSLHMYFIYSAILTGFIYPVVVHAVWDAEGWLTAFRDDPILGLDRDDPKTGDGGVNGYIDYAGSSVVHAVGGFAGLAGAIVLGPRQGRFVKEDNAWFVTSVNEKDFKPQNYAFNALGVFLLLVGWLYFNGASTLALADSNAQLVGKVMVVTIIAGCAGAITAAVIGWLRGRKMDVGLLLNGLLAGLVSITAGCATMDPWAALLSGIIGGVVYYGSSQMLLALGIDDPLDAAPVHGFAGIWGTLAVGIFSERDNIAAAYGSDNDAVGSGTQFATQLIGVLFVVAWAFVMSLIMFKAVDMTVGARISEEAERVGLDISEHGGSAYNRKLDDSEMAGIGPGDEARKQQSAGAVAPNSTEEQKEAESA